MVVAALLSRDPRSPSSQIVRWMIAGGLEYLATEDLIREYREVVARQGIASRIRVTADEIGTVVEEIVAGALLLNPTRLTGAPDPGDDHVWALLASAPNAALVTRDRALLQAANAPGVVMTPAEFVLMLSEER